MSRTGYVPYPDPMASIDRSSDRPAYKQLADLLRRQILTGELAEGSTLPSKRQLADIHGVSITGVVEPALVALKADGMIAMERGRPTRVLPVRIDVARRYGYGRDNYQPEVESSFAREHGVAWSEFAPQLRREYETVPAPSQVAELLGLDPDTPVVRRRWVHVIDGSPIRLAYSYLEQARFGDTVLCDPDEPPWPGGTGAMLASLGYRIDWDIFDVGARPANTEERQLFGLPASEWVLEQWRVHLHRDTPSASSRHGVPVECAVHVWPARAKRLQFRVPIQQPQWQGPAA